MSWFSGFKFSQILGMVSFLHLTMLQLGGEVKLMKEATVEVGFGWKGLKTYSKDTQYSGQVKLAGISAT